MDMPVPVPEEPRLLWADRRIFDLNDAAWSEFSTALDRPVSHKPRLRELFSEASVFDES